MTEIVTHWRAPTHLVVSANELLVYGWAHQHPIAEIERFGRLLAETADARGQVAVLVHITNPSQQASPDERARAALAEVMGSRPKQHRGVAYVVTGSGFGPAIARTAITALNLLARPRFPVQVFPDYGRATRWCGNLLGWPSAAAPPLAAALADHVGHWQSAH